LSLTWPDYSVTLIVCNVDPRIFPVEGIFSSMLAFPSNAPTWQSNLVTTEKSAPNSSRGRAASLIVPRLYLSDYFTVRDEKSWSKLEITHVVSVMEQDVQIPDSIKPENRLQVRAADRSDVDLLEHLGGTTEFIRSALSENAENRVLVSHRDATCCVDN
jgi:atypical dual specificity phosphatase